jgi:erythromycin esterase
MTVPPAVNNSWDSVIHTLTSGNNTLMIFRDHGKRKNKEVNGQLTNDRRGQRAIGVVYNPEYERYGNYVPTVLTRRYDAFLHIDKTHALRPLHMPQIEEDEDLPETFPTGF